MIFISTELLLMLGIIVFYLFDSSVRLFCNEGFLIQSPQHKPHWQVFCGFSFLQWGGKLIFIPNPLRFYCPQFRLAWDFEGVLNVLATEDASNFPADFPPKLPFTGLRICLFGVFIALFVLLPLGFFSYFSHLALIAGLAMLYASIFAALICVWRHKKSFAVSNQRFLFLAFESLICPPFALNLIRHISGGQSLNIHLLAAAKHLQQAADYQHSLALFIRKINDELALEALQSERFLRLSQSLQALEKEIKHGND